MKEKPIGPAAAHAWALAAELRVVIGALSRRLREQSYFGDLTWSQIRVLRRLEREGRRRSRRWRAQKACGRNPWARLCPSSKQRAL